MNRIFFWFNMLEMKNSMTLRSPICLLMRQSYKENKKELSGKSPRYPTPCQMYDSGTIWNGYPDKTAYEDPIRLGNSHSTH